MAPERIDADRQFGIDTPFLYGCLNLEEACSFGERKLPRDDEPTGRSPSSNTSPLDRWNDGSRLPQARVEWPS